MSVRQRVCVFATRTPAPADQGPGLTACACARQGRVCVLGRVVVSGARARVGRVVVSGARARVRACSSVMGACAC